MIPDDIKEKIRIEYAAQPVRRESAEFGYSLAQEQLAEKDKEIAELKADNDMLKEQDKLQCEVYDEALKEIERLKSIANDHVKKMKEILK